MSTGTGTTNPQLLKVSEVAERLAVSIRTAYRLIEDGEIASVRVGSGTRRVFLQDLEAYLTARRTPARWEAAKQ